MDIEKILQNPEIVQIHREPARAYYIPFQDGAMALQADKEESVYYAPLGGDWAFAYYGRSYDVDEAIFDPDGSVEGWDTIPVPSNWQMHGYDVPALYQCQLYHSHRSALRAGRQPLRRLRQIHEHPRDLEG